MSGVYDLALEFQERAIRGNEDPGHGAIAPFPLYAYGTEESLLEWLQNTCGALQAMQRNRAWQMIENVMFYNGVQHMEEFGHSLESKDRRGQYLGDGDVFVMNHARDFVVQKIAMLTRFKPAVNVLPWNSSYRDILGAKFSKRAIDTCFYNNHVSGLFRMFAGHAVTCGEGYLRVSWDKHMGDITREQAEANVAKSQGMLGEDELLQPFEQPDGTIINLDVQQRAGDVKVECIYPWLVLKETAQSWDAVNYIFVLNVKHKDQIRLENPGIALDKSEGRIDGGTDYFGAFSSFAGMGDYLVEVEFFHRSTPFLDAGFYAKFVDGAILETGTMENSSGKIPFVRLTDYDDMMTPHGRSFLNDLRPPLILHNKLLNLMYRNVAIAGHPKLMIPTGSVNVASMGSGPFVVEYDGPQKPEIMTFNAIGGEVFTLSESFMSQIQKVGGVSGMSRGDSIPNARAAEILSIYQEQEEQRNGPLTDKYVSSIEQIGKLVLNCAAANYKADDARLLKVFGQNNRYKLRKLLETSTLQGPSDVVMERNTSLDDTRQGKINKIVQLSQIPLGEEGTGVFKKEQIIRMLDLGDTESFFDLQTNSVDDAKSENEDMYEELPVVPPQVWHNHIIHWSEHYLFMQSPEFSDPESVPQEVRNAFIEHMLVHETLMYDKAKQSLAYAQELMTLLAFPVFITIGPESGLPQNIMTIAQLIMHHQMPPMPPGGAPPQE